MKSKLFRYTSIFIAILMLAGLFLGAMTSRSAAVTPPAKQADTLASSNGNVSAKQAPGWTAATKAWSKERMLAAKPYPMNTPSGERAIDISPDVADGESGFKPSSLPMDARNAAGAEADMGVLSSPSPLGYSFPAPFTRYNNFDAYTVFPYVTVGKLFFTQYGVDYVCSASSIGNYAIWTAGHCVHAGDGSQNGWSYDVVFVPAYKNGNAPKGVWYGYNLWTKTAWFNGGALKWKYDMGGVILYTNASGYKISQIVGNLGFAYGGTRIRHWFQTGYPQGSPFTGKWQVINTSSYAYNDTSMGTPYPVGVGSDLTGGSSGGPWIYKFSGTAGSTNYLNGHNDYNYGDYREMFSPFFGTAAYDLWSTLLSDTAP